MHKNLSSLVRLCLAASSVLVAACSGAPVDGTSDAVTEASSALTQEETKGLEMTPIDLDTADFSPFATTLVVFSDSTYTVTQDDLREYLGALPKIKPGATFPRFMIPLAKAPASLAPRPLSKGGFLPFPEGIGPIARSACLPGTVYFVTGWANGAPTFATLGCDYPVEMIAEEDLVDLEGLLCEIHPENPTCL